jgi:nucleotide-binding universal stress UspA family protein
MYKNILLPTDGSAQAEKAVIAGIKLAAAVGARVTGLYVAPPPTPLVYEKLLPKGYLTTEKHEALIEKTAKRILSVVEKAAAAAGVKSDVIVVTGDFPADAIVRNATSRKCDLIFIAPQGQGGFSKLLLGSQTQKVVALAKVPVLVHR